MSDSIVEPFIGEVRMFAGNYAPVGWALCDGSLLQLSEYTLLFTLIETTYGGDGVTTFAVPDLRGRAPLHKGAGSGITPILQEIHHRIRINWML
jgi:microcystin-dependent protein